MADINPAFSTSTGVATTTWAAITSADTPIAMLNKGGARGTVQFSGTFGGATIALHGSNDGSNFFLLKNVHGTDITVTAAGMHEFNSSALYIKPVITGGSGYSLNAICVLRGK
jgi:hypothetical protein